MALALGCAAQQHACLSVCATVVGVRALTAAPFHPLPCPCIQALSWEAARGLTQAQGVADLASPRHTVLPAPSLPCTKL